MACPHKDLLDATTYGDLPNKVEICAACGQAFMRLVPGPPEQVHWLSPHDVAFLDTHTPLPAERDGA